jgi:hypothetical protein
VCQPAIDGGLWLNGGGAKYGVGRGEFCLTSAAGITKKSGLSLVRAKSVSSAWVVQGSLVEGCSRGRGGWKLKEGKGVFADSMKWRMCFADGVSLAVGSRKIT